MQVQGVALAWRKGSFYTLAVDGDLDPSGVYAMGLYEPPVAIKGKTVVFGAGLSGSVDSSGIFMARLK